MSSKKQQMAIRVASLYLKRANIQGQVNSPLTKDQKTAFNNVIKLFFVPFLQSYSNKQTHESIQMMTEGINKYPMLHKDINEVYVEFHKIVSKIVQEIKDSGLQINPQYFKALSRVEELYNESLKLFNLTLPYLKRMSADLNSKKFHQCDATLAELQAIAKNNIILLQRLLNVVQQLKNIKPFVDKPQQQEEPKKNWFQRMFKLANGSLIQHLEVRANDLLQIWSEDFYFYFEDAVQLRNACIFYTQPERLKEGTHHLLDVFPKQSHPKINHQLQNLSIAIDNIIPADNRSWDMMVKEIERLFRFVKEAIV
jgi:hypothetical protein